MPPRVPNILPRQPGETPYAYRNRRSIALTGQTLYERRRASGIARGLTTADYRGHQTTAAGTEYERRRASAVRRTGFTPSQLYYMKIDAELIAAGYTPASTGMSQTNLRRVWPRLKWINAHTSPGGELTPDVILEATDMEREGSLYVRFAYDHINQRYESMYNYKELFDNTDGNYWWFNEYMAEYDGQQSLRQWWYYH